MTQPKKHLHIVLARLEEDFRIIQQRRTDLGERPIMEPFQKPVACMWLNRGTEKDVAKAQVFARTEGYTVFTYDMSVRKPYEQALKDVLKQAE